MRPLAALLLLSLFVRADDTKPADEKAESKKKRAGDIVIGEPGTPIQDRAVARQEASRFKKAFKDAPTDEERIELLERLGKWDHPQILKAASKYLKDRNHLIAIAATVVCAKQASQKDKAGRAVFGALRREKRNHVICAQLVAMGVLGYDNRSAVREALSYFRRNTAETHKAATRYLGYVKYKPAFRLLAEKLDEPRPKNPNDPRNPPASYWRERWYEWDRNVKYTRWAISQLVPGETFEQTEEAKNWAERHGAEHGIEW